MRTDGLQELLLKDPTILNNNDRITKMRKAIQAVSIAARSVFQQLVHRSMPFFSPTAFSVEEFDQSRTTGFFLCQVHGTGNCLCQR